ncbi:MAG: 50S ribosomal protein L1 [Candidatus Aenigmatarchaeota archaeon]
MEKKEIVEVVKKAREGAKKRNFKQSFDMAINFKNLDLKKAENKIKTEVLLPKGMGKELTIGVFADTMIPQVKKLEGVVLIRKDELEGLKAKKKQAKALANKCHAFLSEAPLMPLVGKFLGPVLAVRNKMPRPVPPTLANIEPLVKRARNTVRIVLRDSPAAHCRIGVEEMSDDDVAENALAVLKAVETALPKGITQMKNANIKLTMGKPVKIVIK